MNVNIRVKDEHESGEVASQIGKNLAGGECIEFVSDLGGGKTTFIREMVSAAGSTDIVSSPTFTVGKQYKTPNLQIYHYDFYRLHEPGLVSEELREALEDKDAVVLIEWGETVSEVLPEQRIRITIDKLADNPTGRSYAIDIPEEFQYVAEGLQ